MEKVKTSKEMPRVLIVDDEAGIRRVLRIYLEDRGHEVVTATDGKKAVSLINKESFDLVLTDIRMPGMDGLELLQYIKHKYPETQVVMITGHGDYKLAIKSLKLDAVDFIPKPIDNDIFEIALKRAEEKIQARKQIEKYTLELEDRVKEKTKELEASEKKYIRLFNESPNYLTVQDENLKIVDKNRSFEENFEYKKGMTCFRVYKGRDSACPDCPVLKTFADGKSHSAEMDVILKDGSVRDILIKTSAITDEKGKVTHVMEMSTDVTMIHELQDHLASLGLHISSISHGLKQALTGMDGGAYLLESGLKKANTPLVAEGWEIVKDKISATRNLVLDILFHSKKRELEKTKIQLSDLISEVASSIRPRADRANVKFELKQPQKDVQLFIDKKAMTAAFMSILENAVEACEDKKGKGVVKFEIKIQDSCPVFVVRDNGRGIKEESRDKIFDLFYSQKGNQGTGLGLFIASRSIKQHEGSIQVRSEENKFTEFTISLPLVLN